MDRGDVFDRLERDAGHDTRAEQRGVVVGIVAEPMQVGALVQVLVRHRCARGELLQPAVDECPVGQPRRRREKGAVDRVAGVLAGRDVENVQHALFGATFGNAVRDVLVVRRRLEVVDRVVGARRGRPPIRIDQQRSFPPVPCRAVQLQRIVAGEPLQVVVVAVVRLHAGDAGGGIVTVALDLLEDFRALRNPVERRASVVGLRLHPGGDRGILQVLERAVRIGDGHAVVGVADRLAGGRRRLRLRECGAGGKADEQCGKTAHRDGEQGHGCSGCDMATCDYASGHDAERCLGDILRSDEATHSRCNPSYCPRQSC